MALHTKTETEGRKRKMNMINNGNGCEVDSENNTLICFKEVNNALLSIIRKL